MDFESWIVGVGFGEQLYIKHMVDGCEDGFDFAPNDKPTVQDLMDLIAQHKCPMSDTSE